MLDALMGIQVDRHLMENMTADNSHLMVRKEEKEPRIGVNGCLCSRGRSCEESGRNPEEREMVAYETETRKAPDVGEFMEVNGRREQENTESSLMWATAHRYDNRDRYGRTWDAVIPTAVGKCMVWKRKTRVGWMRNGLLVVITKFGELESKEPEISGSSLVWVTAFERDGYNCHRRKQYMEIPVTMRTSRRPTPKDMGEKMNCDKFVDSENVIKIKVLTLISSLTQRGVNNCGTSSKGPKQNGSRAWFKNHGSTEGKLRVGSVKKRGSKFNELKINNVKNVCNLKVLKRVGKFTISPSNDAYRFGEMVCNTGKRDDVSKGGNNHIGNENKIQLFLRTLPGKTITLNVYKEKKIEEVKKEIYKREGIPQLMQRIIWNGKELKDWDGSIGEIFKNGDTLHVLLRLKGGMEEGSEYETKKVRRRMDKIRLSGVRNMVLANISADNISKHLKSYENEYIRVLEEWSELKQISAKEKLTEEYEELEREISDIEKQWEQINRVLEDRANIRVRGEDSGARMTNGEVEERSLRNLRRISIPIFDGKIREYAEWKAVFEATIGMAKERKEEKMLHLRNYLRGEPLRMIEALGFSSEAYDTALRRLEERYGGEEREYRRIIEKIGKLQHLRDNDIKGLEELVMILDVLLLRLKDMKKEEECGSGFLYQEVLKKLPEKMIREWSKEVSELGGRSDVKRLQVWLQKEIKLTKGVREILYGVENDSISSERHRERYSEWKGRGETVKTHLAKGTEGRKGNNVFTNTGKNEGRTKIDSSNKNKVRCALCEGTHYLDQCYKFKSMGLEDRAEFVKGKKLCFNCLKSGHEKKECRKEKLCKINKCKGKHNFWLHREQEGDTSERVETHMGTCHSTEEKNMANIISLRTIPVILEHGEKRIEINALLDDASTASYLSTRVADELDLKGEQTRVEVGVVGGFKRRTPARIVSVKVESLDGNTVRNIRLITMRSVAGDLESIDWREESRQWTHLRGIPFPRIKRREVVDMLIGSDCIDLHQSLLEVRGNIGEPVARLTPLGWTCVGKTTIRSKGEQRTNFTQSYLSLGSLDAQLKRFWEVEEETGSRKGMLSKENEEIFKRTRDSMKKKEGRYEVSIPWKKGELDKSQGRAVAMKRLELLEKKLNKDGELKTEYRRVIRDYEEKGYVRKIDLKEEEEKGGWLLPHFPVIKKDRETTKVRVVFDAAAKTNGISLNDVIETGPNLQNELFDVLLRFRKNKFAIACDISEMFLQVAVNQKDRKYLRFLWKDQDVIETYEFNRVVFGLNVSPFLAQLVAQENAKMCELEFPREKETICDSTYMDDSLDSIETIEEGKKLVNGLREVWKRAGMKARKWISNEKSVLEGISEDEKAETLNIEDGSTIVKKTLGLIWDSRNDVFKFMTRSFEGKTVTKRNLLSWIAKIFDPLGVLAAFTIRGKMLMQNAWMLGLEWDERLPRDLENQVKVWIGETEGLSQVYIPRLILNSQQNEWRIHVFSDASELAYGAVVYLREEIGNQVEVKFITAKGKVTPLKTISIPRLELMGACLGVKLATRVMETLGLEHEKVTFWTDSQNVLSWIRQRCRVFKPFVANRVGQIQSDTKVEQWRYVSSEQNPADQLSRGVNIEQLVKGETWWGGPKFLRQKEAEWPEKRFEAKEDAEGENKKLSFLSQAFNEERSNSLDCFEPRTFSSWKRLIRVRAWVLRFIHNIKEKREADKKSGAVIREELRQSEISIIKQDQELMYRKEVKKLKEGKTIDKDSHIAVCNPRLDEDGVMRSNSRIINASFMESYTKYPIIMSKSSWVSWLIVREYHEEMNHHGGVNHLLSRLNERYWILGARHLIRSYEQSCMICKKKRGKGLSQMMAPLPSFRMREPSRAFVKVGTDFAGPFETVQPRGRVRQKRYLCLFTCLDTRAVHLEVAYGLDTDSFIKAFSRFMSRRGRPELVVSDNGRNFVGATKEIEGIFVCNYKYVNDVQKLGIRWIFNPPGTPHFGGVFESMIKAAKRAIKEVLAKADLTDEELHTAFAKAEEFLNTRPLCYQSNDPKESEVLTPNHFLRASWVGEESMELQETEKSKVLKRWKRIQEVSRHVWQRWMKEVVISWRGRAKWKEEVQGLSEGDVVQVIENNVEAGKWHVGRVLKLVPGEDEKTRVVKLKVNGKEVIRPIGKLIPLEVIEQKVLGVNTKC